MLPSTHPVSQSSGGFRGLQTANLPPAQPDAPVFACVPKAPASRIARARSSPAVPPPTRCHRGLRRPATPSLTFVPELARLGHVRGGSIWSLRLGGGGGEGVGGPEECGGPGKGGGERAAPPEAE